MSLQNDHLTFFWDERSRKISEIAEFLKSAQVETLKSAITQRTYVVLGGDGTMIQVAKEAHNDGVSILGVNYGTKGFLLHDRSALEGPELAFDSVEYPILHVSCAVEWEETRHGLAFNEVYVTRAGHSGSIHLGFTHRKKVLEHYIWDGLMVSTPAGSTGWSKSYKGVVLPHNANLNALTPVGNTSPSAFQATVIEDKGRVRINSINDRINPLDVLADNVLIAHLESRPTEITIERASRGVKVLIERNYREKWDAKVYAELGFGMR